MLHTCCQMCPAFSNEVQTMSPLPTAMYNSLSAHTPQDSPLLLTQNSPLPAAAYSKHTSHALPNVPLLFEQKSNLYATRDEDALKQEIKIFTKIIHKK